MNIQVDPDEVIIQGQRNDERSTSERGYFHSERSYGSFYRTIPLPEGADVDAAKASFKDGVLNVEVPLPQQRARGRTLEISEGSSSRSGSAGQTYSGSQGESSSARTGGERASGESTQR